MRMINFIKVLILLTHLTSYGQKDFEDRFNGFVVTEDNVMVKGYLTFEVGNIQQGTKILVATNPNDAPQLFYTLELKGYAYKKDTFRIIRNLQPYPDDEEKFIEVAEAKIISNGKLVLYELLQYEKAYTPTTVAGAAIPTGIPGVTHGSTTTLMSRKQYKVYVIKDTKKEMIGVKKENFKSVMRDILTDAPDLLAKIDNKALKFKHLEEIIDEYNQKFR